MRGTDVAILELDSTRSGVIGLAAYGLAEPPSSGDEVRVVGVPVDALEPTEQVLRGATCTASATSRVVESDSVWDDAVSTDCAGIVSGSAGSPVLGTGTSPRVAAIVNTTSIGATDGTTCALGQPCEVSSTGAAMVANRTYAVPVEEWAACFSPSWDPSAPGCPTEPAPTTVDAPVHDVPPGATWAATIGGGTGGPYVAKAGPVASTDCRDAAGYALTATTFDQPVGLLDGVYVLCAASLDARNAPDTTQAGNAIMVIAASTPS